MGTYKVLITDNVDNFVIDELRKAGLDVDYKPGISKDELLRVISNYNILVVRSRTKVTKEVIDQAVSLKLIARIGVGLDNIDINYAKSKNIDIINTPEGPTESVAELTIGLMICAARYITLFDKLVKSGEWPKGKYVGFELMGKTLGVIGFGRIGTRVSEIARTLGMHVLAYDIIDITEKARRIGVEPMKDMYELLSKSDIVSLHVPLTRETYHMIGYREFEVMKRGVIIVNTSRGEVIDTKALLDALKSGKVAAAALDVLEHEPPKEPWELELVNHPRVIITPHIGSETIEARKRNAELLVTKILNHLGLSR